MDYEDVKKGLEEHTFLLIDVRNPEELQTHGRIPGSFNIPCKYFKHIYYIRSPSLDKVLMYINFL